MAKTKTIKKAPILRNDESNEILTSLNKKVILNFGDSILEMNCDLDALSCTMKLFFNDKKYILDGSFTESEV